MLALAVFLVTILGVGSKESNGQGFEIRIENGKTLLQELGSNFGIKCTKIGGVVKWSHNGKIIGEKETKFKIFDATTLAIYENRITEDLDIAAYNITLKNVKQVDIHSVFLEWELKGNPLVLEHYVAPDWLNGGTIPRLSTNTTLHHIPFGVQSFQIVGIVDGGGRKIESNIANITVRDLTEDLVRSPRLTKTPNGYFELSWNAPKRLDNITGYEGFAVGRKGVQRRELVPAVAEGTHKRSL